MRICPPGQDRNVEETTLLMRKGKKHEKSIRRKVSISWETVRQKKKKEKQSQTLKAKEYLKTPGLYKNKKIYLTFRFH